MSNDAAYQPDSFREADVGLYGGSHLVVILDVDGTLIQAVAQAYPDGTADQLCPIAKELVNGLEAALG
ncbi:hypothetical protein ACFXNW_10605 [Nocardia sp. NPDC059180]|uniref:hypothetical protein n=1 Tax=Nocardia sp. NPDC059180 TaxID=3346761 RepID=UPI0036B77CBB